MDKNEKSLEKQNNKLKSLMKENKSKEKKKKIKSSSYRLMYK